MRSVSPSHFFVLSFDRAAAAVPGFAASLTGNVKGTRR